MGWDSVVGIATPYTMDSPGIESWWGEDLPFPLGLALGPTHLLYNGYWVSFLGVKQLGRGIDYPSRSSAKVKERVGLHLYSPFEPSWPVIGWTLFSRVHYTLCIVSGHLSSVMGKLNPSSIHWVLFFFPSIIKSSNFCPSW